MNFPRCNTILVKFEVGESEIHVLVTHLSGFWGDSLFVNGTRHIFFTRKNNKECTRGIHDFLVGTGQKFINPTRISGECIL